jgi:hypothetical protein
MTDPVSDDGLTPPQGAARAPAEADLALPQPEAFLDMVSATEGTQRHGYNTAFGGGRITDLSSFPGTGRNTASGRHQITSNTFSDAQDALHRGAGGKVEWVELTCPVRPANRASVVCRRQADWIVGAFMPAWSGRRLWTTKLFQAPPRKGRWIKASVGKATVLAQIEGPEDLAVDNIVLGVTIGDPAAWDLPR